MRDVPGASVPRSGLEAISLAAATNSSVRPTGAELRAEVLVLYHRTKQKSKHGCRRPQTQARLLASFGMAAHAKQSVAANKAAGYKSASQRGIAGYSERRKAHGSANLLDLSDGERDLEKLVLPGTPSASGGQSGLLALGFEGMERRKRRLRIRWQKKSCSQQRQSL